MSERPRYELHEHTDMSRHPYTNIRHAHADGSTPHSHPNTGPACYDRRKQYRVKPNGPQLEYIPRPESESTFHVVFVDEYTEAHRSCGISRARWEAERAAFLADMAAETVSTHAVETLVSRFRLIPLYEIRNPHAETKEAADD